MNLFMLFRSYFAEVSPRYVVLSMQDWLHFSIMNYYSNFVIATCVCKHRRIE